MNINTEAQKDPSQLEREVDERRAHMGETLNALEEKLSPNHLIEQVLDYSRKNGGEFSRNLVNTVKNNPVPTLLTAVGLAWLMSGQNKSASAYQNQNQSLTGTASDTAAMRYGGHTTTSQSSTGQSSSGLSSSGHSSLAQSASHSAANLKHRAADMSSHLREQAQHTSESPRHQGQRARASFGQLLEEQPLAMGALGIAIGALLGGSLPSTQTEDRLMGSSRDKLADKASHQVKETYEKAADMGQKAMQEAKSENRPSSGASSYTTQ